jgi:signal transduction histidine kinase
VFLTYLISIVSVALAAVAAVLLQNVDTDPSPMFVVAVMCSAWFGGWGPGLTATVLAGACATIIFVEPPHAPGFGADDAVRVGVFLGVAVLVSYLQASSRKSMEAIQRAKDQAEAASRAKDHFLAILSHELRTPLNPVLASVSVLEVDENLPQATREDLRLIRRNIELEARLIDDLLDVARLSRGKMQMHFEVLDAHGALRDAVRICQDESRTKRQTMHIELLAQQHHVRADPARLRQVFWNLLRNAIKFTPPGGSIAVSSLNTPDGRLQVQVQDSGIGMEAATLGRIFRPFEQGNSSIESRFGGMGLGLAISHELIALHCGELSAASEGLGHGATLTVRIPTVAAPVPICPAPKPSAGPATTAAHVAHHLRLLLVEDHEDTLKLMARLLQRASYDVTAVRTVGTALESAAQHSYDLVISDLGLPDGSGHELMRALREKYGMKGIALSGFGAAEDVASSRDAGFAMHLTKPIDFRLLESAIEQVAPNHG